MTVGELLEVLRKVKDKNRVVIVASDSEGNQHSPLHQAELCHYRPINSWQGKIISEDELYQHKDGDQDAFVLFPTR